MKVLLLISDHFLPVNVVLTLETGLLIMNRNVFLRCPKVADPRTKETACGEGLLASSAQSGIKVKGCICKGEAGGLSVIPAFKRQRQEK